MRPANAGSIASALSAGCVQCGLDWRAGSDRLPSRALRAICLAAFAALLAAAAIRNAHALNPDAVAYIRIGEYFSRGDLQLAVSGYWSPLLSWMIALVLRLGMAPLPAARLVMALSAIVYVVGCAAVLRREGRASWAAGAGVLIAALAATSWSVELITPDLLAGGLLCLAVARLMAMPQQKTTDSVVAGLTLGLAYLAKAVALPFAVLATLAYAVLSIRHRPGSASAIVRNASLTLAVTMVVALPWIGVISVHYGSLLFSTSAGINHALAGPPPLERSHPSFRTVARPEAGRITSWEEPSRLGYATWSPFASAANLRYQSLLIGKNLWTFVRMLDEFGSAIAIVALAGLAVAGKRLPASSPQAVPVGWYFVPIALLIALYAPLHIDTENLRFFYALLPFIFIVGMEGVALLTQSDRVGRDLRIAAAAAGILLFAWSPAVRFASALCGRGSTASENAFKAGQALRRSGLTAPVVGGAGKLRGVPGLAVAFFIDQPWYGDLQQPSAAAYERSGAGIVVVSRWSSVARELSADARAGDLDPILFPGAAERARSEIRLFALRPSGIR